MIKYQQLRQYNQSTDKISFNLDKKEPYALIYYPENGNFIMDSPRLSLRNMDFSRIIIPTTMYPKTILPPNLRPEYRRLKLTPYPSNSPYPTDGNIIVDLSLYMEKIDVTYKPNNYFRKAGMLMTSTINGIIERLPSNFRKILLYTIDLTKPYPTFFNRRFFLELKMMRDSKGDLPFDDLLLGLINVTGCRYRLLVKDKDYEVSKILPWLKNFRAIDVSGKEQEANVEKAADIVVSDLTSQNLIKKDNVDKYKAAVTNYLSKDDSEKTDNILNANQPQPKIKKQTADQKREERRKNQEKSYRTAIASILFRTSGNLMRTNNMVKKISNHKLDTAVKVIDKNYTDELLPLEKPQNLSTDEIVNKFNIADMVDNKYPGHIFKKRSIDFEINLKKDMINAFKVLENKDIPIKLSQIEIAEASSRKGELAPSDLSILSGTLTDEFGNEHSIKMELPKINPDGTFRLYGQRKCLINQMILDPISFPKQYMAKFESSYAIFHIYSRKLKTGNHLEIYIGSYTLPLMILMSYSFGFEKVLSLFGIGYRMDTKLKKNDYALKVGDGQYLIFENIDTTLKEEMCRSIIKANIHKFPIEAQFGTRKYFNDLIIKMTGRVSSTYTIETTLDNVVEPIVRQILINQQLPIDLDKIMYYMAEKVSSGYIQDRNDLSNQRIRNSEVLVHLAQKQILAAYTTYREQVLSGNKQAKLDIQSNKVLNDFIRSEIVQNMEYSNPAEEMSVLTRISPVGKSIGGIPSRNAVQLDARNVHVSYFGNIDPLDTPEGDNIGVVQQLSIDAYMTTSRGLIQVKDVNNNEHSGVLSTSTCMVPFVENNDGVRMMMSANQSRQALPLKGPEQPAVQTGYETLLANVISDYFIKRSPCNGKISSITEDKIIISCVGGTKAEIDMSPVYLKSGSGKNTLSIFKPIVKVGESVKKNEAVAEGSCIKDGVISQGRNLLVAVMPYKGFNYEDGIVINEKLIGQEKLTSLHLVEEDVLIEADDRITYFYDKVGQYTEKGEHLVRKTIGQIEKLIGFEEDSESDEFIGGQQVKKSPGGLIVEIEVFNNLHDVEIPEKLKEFAEKTEKKYGKPEKENFTIKGNKIEGILIRYKIQQELKISSGDKLCNRYGAKGIISLIEKDEIMPRTPWGETIDIIVNPLGILNRMNIGQLYELYTGFISKELMFRIMKVYKDRKAVIELLNKTIGILDSTKGKKASKEFIGAILKLKDADYLKMIKQLSENKFFPMIIPPFQSPNYQQIKQVLANLDLRAGYNLTLPEHGIKTTYKVPVGYMYFLKLEHLGDLKIHARGTGPVTSKYMQPTSGKRRDGGQRVGEADSYALVSYGALFTLQEFFGPMSDDQRTKNEYINEIVTNGETHFKKPKSNPSKDLLSSYFISMMLDYEV